MRVTVLLTEREHATLLRACGGRGVATLLASAGLREAEAMTSPAALAGEAALFLNQMNGNFPAPEPISRQSETRAQRFIGNPPRNGWTDSAPHFVEPAEVTKAKKS